MSSQVFGAMMVRLVENTARAYGWGVQRSLPLGGKGLSEIALIHPKGKLRVIGAFQVDGRLAPFWLSRRYANGSTVRTLLSNGLEEVLFLLAEGKLPPWGRPGDEPGDEP